MIDRILFANTLTLVLALFLGASCSMRSPNGALRSYAFPPAQLGNWDRVLALDPGADVIVGLQDGSSVRGRLSFANADGMAVQGSRSGDKQIARSSVETVRLRTSSRGSGADGVLIGAAVGGGAGALLAIGVSESIDVTTRLTVPILGAVGAATGALVGSLADRRTRSVLVYRFSAASEPSAARPTR